MSTTCDAVGLVGIPPAVPTQLEVGSGGGPIGPLRQSHPIAHRVGVKNGPTNRHPVDELADVRSEMKKLKTREDELRAMILDGECDLTGDQHEASVRETQSERVDTVALKRELGLERLRPFMRPITTQTVTVKAREVPEYD